MLGWFTGPSRPPDAQGLRGGMSLLQCSVAHAYLNLDGSPSNIDEGPETPAPIFAVRAFKSALFGTPRIDQDALATPASTPADHRPGKKDRAGRITKAPKLKQTIQEEPVTKPRTVSLMSPGKGILLTPGTGAARRKNVSFGGLAFNEKAGNEESYQADPMSLPDVDSPSTIEAGPRRPQTNLTKALYRARIGTKKEDNAGPKEPDGKAASVKSEVETKAEGEDKEDVVAGSADITVDLNHPFSRSGQHWKAEYERYFKNSDREMKKIIKYGQSVKSFAAKKDSEASYLGEKLDQELSKVAEMEAKVSALAAQLATARVQGSEDSDQGKLVEELSKQTALAVRYQQKADKYRAALLKTNPVIFEAVDGVEPATLISSQNILLPEVSGPTEEILFHAELEKYRDVAKRAEEKASRLETENSMLTKALSKARTEAKSYEASRLAMEESFKKKEIGFTAAKEDYEAQIKKIMAEHEKALRKFHQQKYSKDEAISLTTEILKGENVVAKALANGALYPKTAIEIETPQSSKSPYRSRTQQSHVDIWSLGGHGDRLQDSPSRRKPAVTQMFDSTGVDLSVLKEIDRNVIPDLEPQNPAGLSSHTTISDADIAKKQLKSDPPPEESFTPDSPFNELDSQKAPLFIAPQVYKSSTSRRMRDRRSTVASPRPSMVNFSTSPRKMAPTQSRAVNITTQLPMSDNNFANNDHLDVPSFVSIKSSRTAGSKRQTALPPDRLAAAKARLKEKSMERIAIGEGPEGKTWRRVKENSKGQRIGVGEEEEKEGGGPPPPPPPPLMV